jgi:hypothetical protein
MRTKVPTINQGWHPHGYDDARRLSAKNTFWSVAAAGLRKSEARPENLFKQPLQQGGHGTEPERIDNDNMVAPQNVSLKARDSRASGNSVKLGFRVQERKRKIGERRTSRFMTGADRFLSVRRDDRVVKSVGRRIRVPIDD